MVAGSDSILTAIVCLASLFTLALVTIVFVSMLVYGASMDNWDDH